MCTHTHTHIYIYIYIYTHTHTGPLKHADGRPFQAGDYVGVVGISIKILESSGGFSSGGVPMLRAVHSSGACLQFKSAPWKTNKKPTEW